MAEANQTNGLDSLRLFLFRLLRFLLHLLLASLLVFHCVVLQRLLMPVVLLQPEQQLLHVSLQHEAQLAQEFRQQQGLVAAALAE